MPINNIAEFISETNIAESLDDRELDRIGRKVVEGYETDISSRREWEDKYSSYLKLAMQVKETKTFPWQGAANIKYPLLTTAALQFGSRAYPALVPGNNVVQGRVVGKDVTGEKTEKAIRIGKHMSYQLLEQMESWEDDMDKLCLILPILGCAFKKTYYSTLKKTNISELVLPSHLVVNYHCKCIEDAYRITHVIEMMGNQIEERKRNNIYLDVDIGQPSDYYYSNEIRRTSDDIHGIRYSGGQDESVPYTILEQHTFLDLDDDGYEEPYIVTVDMYSGKVLRITARFDLEGITTDEDGNNILRIEPVHYFTKYSFIHSPDGSFYDIGFGALLGPINDVINTTTNQLLDAGTLSNLQSGFLARGIRLKGGITKFAPGEWKNIPNTGDDIRKGVFPLPVREPSMVLFQLLGMMINAGEKLANTIDSLTGENPGQNQKATTTLAVIDQGMKVFTGINKRMYRSFKKELKKLFRLNSIYISNEEYFNVLDSTESDVQMIGGGDYNISSFDVIPNADPGTATEQQKLAKASGLMQLIQMGMIANPQEAGRRILEAQEQPAIEALMTPPGPPKPSFEEIQFQDESARDWARIELDRIKTAATMITAKANAIAAIAKAEATEAGTQIDLYKSEVDQIGNDIERVLKMIDQQRSKQVDGGNIAQ